LGEEMKESTDQCEHGKREGECLKCQVSDLREALHQMKNAATTLYTLHDESEPEEVEAAEKCYRAALAACNKIKEGQPFPSLTPAGLGRKIERLGKAMQRESSTLPELTRLASDCGLELQFRITHSPTRLAKGELK
jgi:hypothetical protein